MKLRIQILFWVLSLVMLNSFAATQYYTYDKDGIKFTFFKLSSNDNYYVIKDVEITKGGHVVMPSTIGGLTYYIGANCNASLVPIKIYNATSIDFGDHSVVVYSAGEYRDGCIMAPHLETIMTNGYMEAHISAPNLKKIESRSLANGIYLTFVTSPAPQFKIVAPNQKRIQISGDICNLDVDECHSLESLVISDTKSFVSLECSLELNDAYCRNNADLISIDLPNLKSISDGFATGCPMLETVRLNNVSAINAKAFQGCAQLKSIYSPNVEKIGNNAFDGCLALTEFKSDKLNTIYDSAFKGCSSLDKIEAPELQHLSSNVFEGCSVLQSLDFPKLQSIGRWAFSGCHSVRQARFPLLESAYYTSFVNMDGLNVLVLPNLVDFGWDKVKDAFKGRANLVHVEIPKITKVPARAFMDCSNLESIDISSATYLESSAFENCNSISKLDCPAAVTVDAYSFKGCGNLIEVNCPQLTSLSIEVLYNCEKLTSLNVPEVRYISRDALTNTTSLKKVDFPKLEEMERYSIVNTAIEEFSMLNPVQFIKGRYDYDWNPVFADCPNLKKIKLPNGGKGKRIDYRVATNCPSLEYFEIGCSYVSGFPVADTGKLRILCLDSITEVGGDWRDGVRACPLLEMISINSMPYIPSIISSYVLQENAGSLITVKAESAVTARSNRGNERLGTVYAPNLTAIENDAFLNCVNLENIYAPKVSKIGDNAFKACGSLKSVHFQNSLEIGYRAFYDCVQINKVNLPKATKLGAECFGNCKDLTEIVIPELTEMSNRSFVGCENLHGICFPKLTALGNECFLDCKNLKDIYCPELITVGERAFHGCDGLTALRLPSVVDIGPFAFGLCSNLTDIDLPSVKTIQHDAFSGIGNYSISFPNIERIEYGAFWKSEKTFLGSISFTESLQFIGRHAFDNTVFLNIEVGATTVPVASEKPWFTQEAAFNCYEAFLEVSEEVIEDYKSHPVWGKFRFGDSRLDGYLYKSAFDDYDGCKQNPVKVRGCTADGLSEVIFPLDFNDASELDCDVRILAGGTEIENDSYGVCRLEEIDGHKAIIYTAPKSFPSEEEGYACNLEIELRREEDSYTGVIELWRPAVLLVHGLGSDESGLDGIYQTLKSDYLPGVQLMKADYKSSNRNHFKYNTFTSKVIDSHVRKLYHRLLDIKRIVSSKYDLVGHSMGGILSRMYAGSSADNYDRVNRIITINTPHGGSQLANLGIQILQDLQLKLGNAGLFPISKSIDFIEKGAVYDLCVGSSAIADLNIGGNRCVGIPVHTVGSALDSDLPVESGFDAEIPLWLRNFLEGYPCIPRNVNDWMRLYKAMHDGIVAIDSQIVTPEESSTVEYSFYPSSWFATGLASPAHHINTCSWDQTGKRIASLLRSPVDSSEFTTSGFTYHKLVYDCDVTTFQFSKEVEDDASEMRKISGKVTRHETYGEDNGQLLFEAELNETERRLKVAVNASEDIYFYTTAVIAGDEMVFMRANDSEMDIEIPQNGAENLEVIVCGFDAEDNVVTASKNFRFENPLRLHAIYTPYDDQEVSLQVGDVLTPVFYGVWDSSVSRIEPELSADGNGIALVDNAVRALSPGRYNVVASMHDIEASFVVNVLGGSSFKAIESITVAPSDITMTVNEERQLSVEVLPVDHSENNMEWISTDPRIVKVDETGKITGMSMGEAEVIVRSFSGIQAVCHVSVGIHSDISDTMPDSVKEKRYTVWDTMGRIIVRDSVELDLSNLTPGIYIVTDGHTTKKIIVH